MNTKLKDLTKKMKEVNNYYQDIAETIQEEFDNSKEDIISIFGNSDFKVSFNKLNPYAHKSVLLLVKNGHENYLIANLHRHEKIDKCVLTFSMKSDNMNVNNELINGIYDITDKENYKEKVQEAVFEFVRRII